ncbi:acyltransferase family protein [Salisediminibacterium halotolerans]|nr:MULTISPECIES: acyltransferase family protein [Salisediminibacterium]
MKSPQMIKEIFVLRSLGCIGIVLLHSIYIALSAHSPEELGTVVYTLLDSLQVFLYYGTPMFVFISEFVISYSYRSRRLPGNFLQKRLKFIMIPYITMGLLYSIPFFQLGVEFWGTKALMNIFVGDYHGYFVLIIFQFYLVHYFFNSYLKRWSPRVVISAALAVNVLYLAVFNYTAPPDFLPHGDYIWDRFFWVPMFGWVFYFVIGFYSGYYYESFIDSLTKYRFVIFAGPLVSTAFLMFMYHSGILTEHSSKRIDILLHTTAISLFLFYIMSFLPRPPRVLVFISRYSFGIFLFHYAFIFIMDYVYQQFFPYDLLLMYIPVLFIFSLFSSIFVIFLLNKTPYGFLFVGKIGIPYDTGKKAA